MVAASHYQDILTEAETPRPAKHTSSSVESSPVKIRTYDPSALLNPKAAAQKASSTPDYKDIQSNTGSDEAVAGASGPPGPVSNFSNLMEKVHGVSKREAPPMKRMKMSDPEDGDQDQSGQRKTTTFTGGAGKAGIIGQSVRDMRQQAQDESGPPTGLVDLTNDDDDDILMTGSTYTSDVDPKREVCIGSLEVFVNAHRVPFITNKALDKLKDQWPIARINAQATPGNFNSIDMLDRQGKEFGKLDSRASSLLAPLLNGAKMHKFRMTCQLLPRSRAHNEKPEDACSKALKGRVILFCSWDATTGLGRMIQQKAYYLSDTPHTENRELFNPHTKTEPRKVTKIMKTFGTVRPAGEGYIRTTEEIRHEVKSIIDSLPNSEGLPFAEPDKSIVQTELLDHQKQALYWLARQEDVSQEVQEQKNHMWRPVVQPDKSTVWYNVISGSLVTKIPTCLGGLFSDDMGLGKTLSILALIAGTLKEAAVFGEKDLSEQMQQHDYVERNTKSTLLVCPKSVLSNWDEQIKAHLDTQNISYYTYHGTKRLQDVDELANYDLIITSYAIVNSELRGSRKSYSALSKLNFFRVVLDEAHMIRNMTTGMFIACCALATARRWAVTGTPIQNKLDDLGALIRFIQIHPFHEKGAWEMNFVAKFKSGDEQVLPNLKLLVNSIMLRRSKKTINMEDPDVKTVELDFTSEELHLYESFAKDSGQKLKAILSNKGLKGRGTAHMLTFITRLRMICCHGRDLLSDEDMKAIAGQTLGTAIDLGDEDDETPALTDHQAFSMFHMLDDSNTNNCIECGKEVAAGLEVPVKDDDADADAEGSASDTDADEKDDIFGYITPCYHLVCSGACISKFTASLAATATSDRYGHCPHCNQYIRTSIPALSRSALLAEDARRAELRTDRRRARTSGTYSGPHSKVRALLAALDANFAETLALPAGSPPIRSVVFSGWTAYLDLIGMALEDRDIPFLRLDGTMSVAARSRVMRSFREDPNVTVMLVSIRAGGQGLNFTAANKVYVMEPQFNPGVEQQAVDRVHRLGQTRKVEITRFIMRDSFEGRIVELQEQKKRLAREAFGEGGKEDARQRLEGLRSLFR